MTTSAPIKRSALVLLQVILLILSAMGAGLVAAASVGTGVPGAASSNSGSTSTLSITAPAASAGDVLVAQIVATDSISTTFMCLPTTGAWVTDATTGDDRLFVRDTQGKVMVQAFYMVVESDQGATAYTWNFKSNSTSCGTTDNNRTEAASGFIVKFSGVDNDNPIDDVNRTSPSTGSGSAAFAAVTTTRDGSAVLRLLGVMKNNSSASPSTNRIVHANGSGGSERAATMWGVTQATAGTSPAFTATFDSSEYATITLALRSGPDPTAVSDVSGSGTYGSTATLTATLTSGGDPLDDKTVDFELDNVSVGSATTNASGVAELSGVSLTGFNAGTHTGAVEASFAGDDDLGASNGTGDLLVDKADADCTTVTGYDVDYDGQSHTASGECLGVEGETLAGLDLSGTTHTNAGDYLADPWTFTDATGNYNDDDGTVDNSISPKEITGSFTAKDKVYDGNRDAEVDEVFLPGVVGDDDVELIVSNALFDTKDVGTDKDVIGDLSLDGADADNYSLSSDTHTTQADIMACLEPPFSDVPVDHPFCLEIEWMKVEGISVGFGDGTYRPLNAVNRQEMSAFMARLAGETELPECDEENPPFSDVPADHPFCAEIQWMKVEGISVGFGDGTYRPLNEVNRQEMSAFMYRLSGLLP